MQKLSHKNHETETLKFKNHIKLSGIKVSGKVDCRLLPSKAAFMKSFDDSDDSDD